MSLPRIRPISRAAITVARDSLARSTRAEAMAELEAEDRDREMRRMEREERRAASGGDRMRCGGCRRWIRAANHWCGCGFRNDYRGRRNQGGYA